MKAKLVKESLDILKPKEDNEIIDNIVHKLGSKKDAKLVLDIAEKYPRRYKFVEDLHEPQFRFIIYPASHKFGLTSGTVFFKKLGNSFIIRKDFEVIGNPSPITTVKDIEDKLHALRKRIQNNPK